jgi:ribonuclease VapC
VNEADVVLDTSAILSVIQDEPGADFVEARLEEGASDKIVIAVSFVSLTEILYKTIQLADKRRADELVAVIKSWPVEFVHSDEALCISAGEIKARFLISFADAFVAATAQRFGALLIHKDPEFESLKSVINLKALPYKARG